LNKGISLRGTDFRPSWLHVKSCEANLILPALILYRNLIPTRRTAILRRTLHARFNSSRAPPIVGKLRDISPHIESLSPPRLLISTMEQPEGPPAYSEYPTELPETFPIGRHQVQPLVNVTELQAHLRLLGAIYKLKLDVQARQGGNPEKAELAWMVYVNRAVRRFYKWASSSWTLEYPGLSEEVMPPLDVIMVWHSYLLVSSLQSLYTPTGHVPFRTLGHTTRIVNGWTRSTAAIW